MSVQTDIYAIGKMMLLPNRHIYKKVIARCTAADPAGAGCYPSVAALQEALFPHKAHRRWLVMLALMLVASLSYFMLTSRKRLPAEAAENKIIAVPQSTVDETERPETIFVSEAVQPIEPKQEEPAFTEQQPPLSEGLSPIKRELSEEEKEFMNQPQLRVLNAGEFERYKQKLAEYFSEATSFLADTVNLVSIPRNIPIQSTIEKSSGVPLSASKPTSRPVRYMKAL